MSDVYQSLARAYSPATRADFPCPGEAERMPDRRGAPDAGPRPYVHGDSAQAPGCLCDWVLKGKECDCHCTAFRKREEFLWRTLVGTRLRSVHHRVRTGADPPILPRAGCRGW